MLIKIKKLIEYRTTLLLAVFSPKLAKKFSFRKEDKLNFLNINSKRLEAELLLLPYLLHKDFHFIDVGANRGLYCFYVEKLIPQEHIIAFEPVPSLSNLLKKVFPKVRVIQKALSDNNGGSILNIPFHQRRYLMNTRSTLETSSSDLSNGFEKISIETITLDDYLASQKAMKVSLIKIDVEGHEIKVISGAKRSLEANKPFLIVEIEQQHHVGSFNEVFTLIDQLGYAIYYFDVELFLLKPAFDPVHQHFTLREEIRSLVHNYVCIPIEKDNIVKTINKYIAENLRKHAN